MGEPSPRVDFILIFLDFFLSFSIRCDGSTLPKFPKLLIHGGYRYLHMKIDDNRVLEFNLEELIGFDPNEPLIDFCLEDLPVFDDLECPDLKELLEFNLDDIPEFKPEDLKGLLEGFGDLDLEGFVDFHIPPNKDIEL